MPVWMDTCILNAIHIIREMKTDSKALKNKISKNSSQQGATIHNERKSDILTHLILINFVQGSNRHVPFAYLNRDC